MPGYIYAFSIIAFFENYGTAFSLLTFLFGESNYNPIIPKMSVKKTTKNKIVKELKIYSNKNVSFNK